MKKICTILLSAACIWSCSKKNDPAAVVENNTTTPGINIVCDGIAAIDMTEAKNFGDGTPASCTQAALQTLINTGGKIKCNCGPDNYTLKLTSTLAVPNKEVIIDGANTLILDGDNTYRIFDKAAAANQGNGTFFALQNMTLQKGNAALKSDERGGGAIYGRAFGSLQVINVKFDRNMGPLSASDDCGAVHTILYKSATFTNCTFTNNKGANGGAVGTIGTGMAFYNCVFDKNEATGTGGTFDKGGSGGAVYVDGTDQNGTSNNQMILCGCKFTNNTAGYQAGAVNIIFYAGKGSTAAMDKCGFENNSCKVDKGGAYYHMNGPLAISNCTFYQNASPVQGGGLWTYNTNVTMTNCTFNKNTAVDGTNGLGGAFTLGSGDAKTAVITNCTFAENKAGNFGSAIFNGGSMTLVNNLFYNNPYGSNPYAGHVINKGSDLTVGSGNLQYPATFTGQYGTGTDEWLTSSVIKQDPQLQPIADNGGPTRTMALPTGSAAIDKGTATGAPATDQRGKPRSGNIDIGAFEAQ